MRSVPLLLTVLPLALGAACAAPHSSARALPAPPEYSVQDSQQDPFRLAPDDEKLFAELHRSRMHGWQPGQALLQGYLGVGYFQSVTLHPDGGSDVEIDADELDNFPVIGGGGQWKLAGERFDFGVEGMLGFSFRSDLEAFAAGGGGAVVVLDVDVLLVDLFGGPFLSLPLGERMRVYAAAGPILHFLEYSQQDDASSIDDDASGWGAGGYARTGIEFRLPSGTRMGFGVRYSSAEIDLGSDIGDFDMEGVQALFTITRGP